MGLDKQPLLVVTTPRSDVFDRFVLEQRPALVSFLRRLTGCEADAEDIAQESFLSLVRYRDSEAETAWKPLLYRIALNAHNDRRRYGAARAAVAHVSLHEGVMDLPSGEAPHDQRVADQQELALVRQAILGLPDRCRQIYLLNRIEGMSYSEIARHCAISVKAVEKQITKALGVLREKIGKAKPLALEPK
ncbi:RNA polymerase sigma factor [Tahibacter amnicola]|uniref:RNA polymerase sigma factor n=1 Tax=Tahibacter amnicola TaxID=2976241 RepID=A0ABY6BKI5_9GAMM|nr:RNA polymerase sigma factor [Tahibacter amnicola]UXI70521.1 RNA polymerase sigma factor [Tahibacter amnicola]